MVRESARTAAAAAHPSYGSGGGGSSASGGGVLDDAGFKATKAASSRLQVVTDHMVFIAGTSPNCTPLLSRAWIYSRVQCGTPAYVGGGSTARRASRCSFKDDADLLAKSMLMDRCAHSLLMITRCAHSAHLTGLSADATVCKALCKPKIASKLASVMSKIMAAVTGDADEVVSVGDIPVHLGPP